MVESKWPERQGDIRAVLLTQSRKRKYHEYEVFQQNKTNGPWYEGTQFYLSISKHHISIGAIDNHSFVMKYHVDGNGNDSENIVAVAHNEKELQEKTYKCAVDYCKKLAKAIEGEFPKLP